MIISHFQKWSYTCDLTFYKTFKIILKIQVIRWENSTLSIYSKTVIKIIYFKAVIYFDIWGN